jgi:PPOX class probable F420-dependent enzyme
MALTIDTSTEFGAKVSRRLAEESIGWLTTVRADGLPQPAPIWFHWDGETCLILSEPTSRRVQNLHGNPKAALHFNCDDDGDDVVIFSGEARTDAAGAPRERLDAYFAKYAEGVKALGTTREELVERYSTAILLTPARVTGH